MSEQKTTNEHRRILVVDDEPQITRVLRTSLSSHGYDIRVANDGETALEIMKDWTPDLVITDLDGRFVEGSLRPSSDLGTHLLLYREFPTIGGVVHTHSEYATAWAQAGREIPAYGTTHADYFYGPVPVTEELTDEEIGGDYVLNTGHAIVRRFRDLDPEAVPGVLVRGHAPFAWGKTSADAAHNAVVLEAVARMAYYTETLNTACEGVSQALLDRHYFRKHGVKATYGQKDRM